MAQGPDTFRERFDWGRFGLTPVEEVSAGTGGLEEASPPARRALVAVAENLPKRNVRRLRTGGAYHVEEQQPPGGDVGMPGVEESVQAPGGKAQGHMKGTIFGGIRAAQRGEQFDYEESIAKGVEGLGAEQGFGPPNVKLGDAFMEIPNPFAVKPQDFPIKPLEFPVKRTGFPGSTAGFIPRPGRNP